MQQQQQQQQQQTSKNVPALTPSDERLDVSEVKLVE